MRQRARWTTAGRHRFRAPVAILSAPAEQRLLAAGLSFERPTSANDVEHHRLRAGPTPHIVQNAIERFGRKSSAYRLGKIKLGSDVAEEHAPIRARDAELSSAVPHHESVPTFGLMLPIRHTAFTAALLLAATSAANAQTRMLRSPSVIAKDIAFAYAGNIWVVGRAGAAARRLTSFAGEASNPKLSPDGSKVAFSAQYAANVDAATGIRGRWRGRQHIARISQASLHCY